MNADKEGFLHNERSLIQTIGRAARNVNGRVIMYADSVTDSMRCAITKTHARRKAQIEFNKEQGITPQTVVKSVAAKTREIKGVKHMPRAEVEKKLIELEAEMKKAAETLDFELAIKLRDMIALIKEQ